MADQEVKNEKYEILRPRNIPRRQFHGLVATDIYLDHSDSFREIQTSDASESVAPDKSISEPAGDKDDGE